MKLFRGRRAKIPLDPDHIYSIPNEVFQDVIKPFEGDFESSEALFSTIANIKCRSHFGPYYFFTLGTGIPDKIAIKNFKDDNGVIVVDRKNRMWRNGKRVKIEKEK